MASDTRDTNQTSQQPKTGTYRRLAQLDENPVRECKDCPICLYNAAVFHTRFDDTHSNYKCIHCGCVSVHTSPDPDFFDRAHSITDLIRSTAQPSFSLSENRIEEYFKKRDGVSDVSTEA